MREPIGPLLPPVQEDKKQGGISNEMSIYNGPAPCHYNANKTP